MSRESKRVLEVVMKTCPVCGLDVEDSYSFCPDDGSQLLDAAPIDETFTQPAEVQPKMPEAAAPVDESFTQGAEVQSKMPEAAAPNDVVVLYCGECAAEYPMTFVECPVHLVPLTRHKFQPKIQPIAAVPDAQIGSAESNEQQQRDGGKQDKEFEPPFQETAALAAGRLPESFNTSLEDNKNREASPAPASSHSYLRLAEFGAARESRSESRSIFAFGAPGETHEADVPASGPASRYDTPSFRIVAAAMVMGLVIFCVIAVYTFFSAGARRQTIARAAQSGATADVIEPPPLVTTPDSARDFQAPQPQEQATSAAPQADAAQRQNPPALPSSTTRAGQVGTDPRNPGHETIPKPTPVSLNRTTDAIASRSGSKSPPLRESPLPRIDPGSVDARLLRVRSMRTGSGVRYDLTFDMQDESGRHTQWERMLISTRSASGVSHTQAVPFVHRLGANGALTFTVSVEMRGSSEPDWHGRVVCTATGADNDGRPLRASFGASVIP